MTDETTARAQVTSGSDDLEAANVRIYLGPDGHISVAGDLDFDSAPAFRDALTRASGNEESELVVDMSAVSFMDSSGLRELASIHSLGHPIRIENASACVRNILRVTHMDELFLGPAQIS